MSKSKKRKKKFFIDSEFSEKPNTIKLISVGIVCEDGREFYAENKDFDEDSANDWVKENVLTQLWHKTDKGKWKEEDIAGGFLREKEISREILKFIGDDEPEFWGYYCDYDWVVFCWLFGAMIDLPEGWPMYCKDLKQWLDQTHAKKIKDPTGEHNSLIDARWNYKLYQHLEKLTTN